MTPGARRRPDGPWHGESARARSSTPRSRSGPLVLGLALAAGLHMVGAAPPRAQAAFMATRVMLPAGFPAARGACPRTGTPRRLAMAAADGAGGEKSPKLRRRATEGTTFVPTENGMLVEVGCINAKHDFIIDEHMLGRLPEHAPRGQPLGTVTLVGAGPGDPDLLTVAALKALKAADVVVADRLVSQEVLELVEGDLKVARKLPGCALEAQREIYRWCAEAVLAGKSVVRLKIGDPYVFGRGGEEVLEFRRLGVEPKVIPGISSALAGPLAAGIPVTHRGVANRVVFCTGMSKEETVPDVPPYHSEQTCVFLMAVGRLPELVEALTNEGYPDSTSVGIIERATTPRERTLRSDLASIVADAAAVQVKAPAIIVVGGVVTALYDATSALMGNAVHGGDTLMPEDMVAAVREARAALALLEDS